MRTKQQLTHALYEISGCRDYALSRMLDRLIDGDETVRADVEKTLDQLDADAAE
jgi:hypothetical protein